jgi:hypothetical protein
LRICSSMWLRTQLSRGLGVARQLREAVGTA